ncbi:MAG: FliM/FliN family flagellar motor switch protein [Bdellovibrionota bacterium]|jgi:hypothetical protein
MTTIIHETPVNYTLSEKRLSLLFSEISNQKIVALYCGEVKESSEKWLYFNETAGAVFGVSFPDIKSNLAAFFTVKVMSSATLKSYHLFNVGFNDKAESVSAFNLYSDQAFVAKVYYRVLKESTEGVEDYLSPLSDLLNPPAQEHFEITTLIDTVKDDLLGAHFFIKSLADVKGGKVSEVKIFYGKLQMVDGGKVGIFIKEVGIMQGFKGVGNIDVSLGKVTISWSDLLKIRSGTVIELSEVEQMAAVLKIGEKELAKAALTYDDGKLRLKVLSLTDFVGEKSAKQQEIFSHNRRFLKQILEDLK